MLMRAYHRYNRHPLPPAGFRLLPNEKIVEDDQQCDEMRCSIIWRPEDNQFHKLNGESIRDMIRALCLTRNHIPGTGSGDAECHLQSVRT
jgi:hypothetical protein